ncbi:MAG: RNA polymerase-binding protein RbpA [Propionicimonas sp.]
MKNNGRVMGRSIGGSGGRLAMERLEPPAPRFEQQYFCSDGHVFELTFFIEAEAPEQWTCPACGRLSPASDGGEVSTVVSKHGASDGKSHLDRLHERRTPKELESLLQEALGNLRTIGCSFPSQF